jgi:hypothetical protein
MIMTDHDLTLSGDARRLASADERRAVLRRAPRPAMSVLAVSPDGGPAEQAWVRDISAVGLGLLLPNRLDFGTQLLIDLETATRGVVHSVLARVAHVTRQPDGQWLIGCALVGELDDDVLTAFQASRVRPANSDCRAWVRFPCDIETVCHTVETTPGEQIPARILNVSAGGVGLLLPCQFETRTLLHLVLPAPMGVARPRILVRVVQARPDGHGNWYLGCEFVDQFSDGEMDFLAEAF